MRSWFGRFAAPVAVAAIATATMTTTLVTATRSATSPEPTTANSPHVTAQAPAPTRARPSPRTPDPEPNRHLVSKRNSRSKADRKPARDNSAAPPGPRESRIQGYVTGYSYWDNTPPGSSEISHPRVHNVAGGAGTYADPITVAVGHDLSSGSDVLDWPAGTRFYLPYLQRYFIVEDTCGDGSAPENGPCHTDYPSPALTWLDLWVGGQNADREASDSCMSQITGVHTVIRNPGSGYRVTRGEVTDNCATHAETP